MLLIMSLGVVVNVLEWKVGLFSWKERCVLGLLDGTMTHLAQLFITFTYVLPSYHVSLFYSSVCILGVWSL